MMRRHFATWLWPSNAHHILTTLRWRSKRPLMWAQVTHSSLLTTWCSCWSSKTSSNSVRLFRMRVASWTIKSLKQSRSCTMNLRRLSTALQARLSQKMRWVVLAAPRHAKILKVAPVVLSASRTCWGILSSRSSKGSVQASRQVQQRCSPCQKAKRMHIE